MQARPKLDYINAVRGIAILLVIVLHVSRAVITTLPETIAYVCAKGSYGVQLFFVARAFTLYISYSNRINIEGEQPTAISSSVVFSGSARCITWLLWFMA